MLPYIAYMDPMGNGMGQGIFHGRRSVVLHDLGDCWGWIFCWFGNFGSDLLVERLLFW